MKPKWIFFDLGWTLVDETEAHRIRLAETSSLLAEFGKQYSVDQLMALCKEAATDFAPSPFHGVLARLGLSDAQLASVKGAVRYAKEKERLYRGVPELLTSLSARFRLGVIANQSKGTEERLAGWGIREHFSLVFASSELGLSKPDPAIFAGARMASNSGPEDMIMVGDRIDNDIGPAKAQGWKAIRVLQGFSRLQEPRSPDEVPDITVEEIGELSANQRLEDLMGAQK
jgi:HAD superfamily hydrolase (TIGR01549 family)